MWTMAHSSGIAPYKLLIGVFFFISCSRHSLQLSNAAASTARSSSSSSSSSTATKNNNNYSEDGLTTMVWLPRDVVYDSVARLALDAMSDEREADFFEETLSTLGTEDRLTLTLSGQKNRRGSNNRNKRSTQRMVQDNEVNQDRSFVLETTTKDNGRTAALLLGVLDGHGSLGHYVAEWGRRNFIQRWKHKQRDFILNDKGVESNSENEVMAWLNATFLDIDSSLPDDIAKEGGATASIVLHLGTKLYFANIGDSQSILAAAIIPPSNEGAVKQVATLKVVYETRLDKPDDPDEYKRLRALGADVRKKKNNARVWYKSSSTGGPVGLAMSRALGDREATGVIAEPTIKVLDIHETITGLLTQQGVDEKSCASSLSNAEDGEQQDVWQVQLFVISATDGLIDSLTPAEMADAMGKALYNNISFQAAKPASSYPGANKPIHPLLAAEELIHTSANQWHRDMQGSYRDDMAISVAKIKLL